VYGCQYSSVSGNYYNPDRNKECAWVAGKDNKNHRALPPLPGEPSVVVFYVLAT